MGQAVANTSEEQKRDDVDTYHCFRFGPSIGASQIRRDWDLGTSAKHLAFSNFCNTHGGQLKNRSEGKNYSFDLGVRAQVFITLLPDSSFCSAIHVL